MSAFSKLDRNLKKIGFERFRRIYFGLSYNKGLFGKSELDINIKAKNIKCKDLSKLKFVFARLSSFRINLQIHPPPSEKIPYLHTLWKI